MFTAQVRPKNGQLLKGLDLDAYEVVHLHSEHFSNTFVPNIPTYRRRYMRDPPRSHPKNTSFSMFAFGENLSFELLKHEDLVPMTYQHIKHTDLGTEITYRDDLEHCFYRAVSTQGRQIAAIDTCQDGFEGILKHPNGHFLAVVPAHLHLSVLEIESHISRLQSSSPHARENCGSSCSPVTSLSIHVVYHAAKYRPSQEMMCGSEDYSDQVHHARSEQHHDTNRGMADHLPKGRSHLDELLHPQAHPTARKLETVRDQYVELLVVNDAARYADEGSHTEDRAVALVNAMGVLYDGAFVAEFYIRITGMVTFSVVDAWDADVPILPSGEVAQANLLGEFNAWVAAQSFPFPVDNAQLHSGRDFESTNVGYAGNLAMCVTGSSGAIIQTTDPSNAMNAGICAHEMGHNLGFFHDAANGNTCPASGYIMNARIASVPTEWSTCSVVYYEGQGGWLEQSSRVCLDNMPSQVW